MTEMLDNLAERMISKIQVINLYTVEWADNEKRFTESRPLNKFDHELRGMTDAMKAMGIEFEFKYNADVTEITAITIMGKRYKV